MTLIQPLAINRLVAVIIVFGTTSSVFAQAPRITSITGDSDGVGVARGRWTGQPTHAPATASNRYINKLATDSFRYGSSTANPYYWDINGENFGSTKGTVTIGPLPTPFSSVTVVSWAATKVRIKVVAYTGYTSSGFTLALRTAPTTRYPSGQTVSTSDSAVGIIKSRGCGQCTWFVARTRIENNLSIPSSAYATTAAIPAVSTLDTGFRPQCWDCLNYNGQHVAIVTTVPRQTNNQDGSITFSFQVSEMNALWDEVISRSTRTYKVSKPDATGKRRILMGIGTNAKSTWVASGYYR